MKKIIERMKTNINKFISYFNKPDKQLKVCLDRIKYILQLSDSGYWIWNIGTNDVLVSSKLSNIFGWDSKEFDNMSIDVFIGRKMKDEDWDTFKEGLMNHVTGGSEYFKKVHYFKNGNDEWKLAETRAKLIERDDAGNPKSVIGIVSDITEKRETENTLINNETFFHEIVEQSADGICIHDSFGNIILVNKKICDMTGYPKEQMESMNVKNIDIKFNDLEYLKMWSEMKVGDSKYSICSIYKNYDRHEYPVEISLVKVKIPEQHGLNEHDDSEVLVSYIRDISVREKAVSALSESEERLSLTMSHMHGCIIILDKDMKHLYVNESYKNITGYDLLDAPDKDIMHYVYTGDYEYVKKTIEKSIESSGEKILFSEFRTLRKEGGYVWWNGSIVNLRHLPAINGLLISLTDITHKKLTELELERADRFDSIGTAARSIAHDFNNKLSVIIGNLDLIRRDLKSKGYKFHIKDTEERLMTAVKVCMQATSLTNRLLTFSSEDVSQKEIVLAADFLNDVMEFVKSGLGSKCIFDYDKSTLKVNIDIDNEQITHTFRNVLSNADDSMKDGGIINILAEKVILDKKKDIPVSDGEYVKISVKDHGVGIPKNIINNIFDPFFTTKKGASGLGLSTCYSIIRKHDGHITVESVVNVGTTVFIYIPISKANKKHETTAELRYIPKKGIRVLVMDSEVGITTLLKDVMTEMKGFATVVSSGEDAINACKNARRKKVQFDIAILDLKITGGMGAKDIAKKILNVNPKINCILSSAYRNEEMVKNYKSYGFVDVLKKPYEIEKISRILCKYAGGKHVDKNKRDCSS